MTCVVALAEARRVWMGADSAGVGGYRLTQRTDPKIYRVGKMLIGYTTSFRMGQLLGYKLSLPEHHQDVPLERYMATSFVDAVRACLKEGGFAGKKEEVEQAGTFLVAYQGRIFRIDSDYQVGESIHGFDACGCGEDLARGSLWTTQMTAVPHLLPVERIKTALAAAEAFSAGVRSPFLIEELDK